MKRTETTEAGHSCPPREVGTIPTEIGTIAADWRIAPLDAVCELPQYGFTASAEAKGNVRFLRITDITDSGVKWPTVPFCECPEKELGKYRLASGDIVFARIGATTGKSYLITNPPPSVFASYLIRVRAKREIYPAFLRQFFRSDAYWRQVDAQKNANLKKGVSGSVLKTLLVPVPPLPEQRKIAGVLGVVQRAMEQQERLLALTAELKKALLHQLFTQGLRGEPQKQTTIGPVPESWEVVPLKTLLSEQLRNGHSAKSSNTGEGIRTLTLTAVTRRDFSVENTKLTVADPRRVRDMWLRCGDILVERANTLEYVGLTALYGGPSDFAIYPDLMIRVRVDEKRIRPKFLAEFLITPVCRLYFQKQAHSTAGNFPKIDQGTVEHTLVPLPSAEEQNEIVLLLTQVDRKENVHRRKHATLTALFRTLLHQLLTAQLRVHNLDLPELPLFIAEDAQ